MNDIKHDIKKRHKNLTEFRYIAVGFFLTILSGAIMLSLPFSSRDGQWTNFLDSLFTATSATCVTGLVVFDTFRHWSIIGQLCDSGADSDRRHGLHLNRCGIFHASAQKNRT